MADHDDRTPPYVRYLARLIRPFPNFDFFFMKSMRQRVINALQLLPGSRALDVGCGPGGSFPYLVESVGPDGEVVGVEISPEVVINAKRRIEANGWKNVQVVEGDARTVSLNGKFDGLGLFAAPDVYASPEALANLLPYLKEDARVVIFGGKLSHRRSAGALNVLFRSLMKLSFSSTPRLNHEPWCVLENRLIETDVREYFFGCMFIFSGVYKTNRD
jgi:phosphatidylethanolamine/phosphatidyl-N-methylethanolamine N-methyltransferase